MGERIRAFDWASTPLGPISGWPHCLRTAVGLCLKSRFPSTVIWGPDFIFLYNDALIPVMEGKHPSALGQPVYESYAEIWPLVGPLLRTVRSTGEASWSVDTLLVLDRKGYLEETYGTFSYIPIVLKSGEVGGCLEVIKDTTERVIDARRLRTLRDLASRASEARTVEEVCGATTDVLAANPRDIPFALLYLIECEGKRARLVTTAGLAPGTPASPDRVDLTSVEPGPAGWPLRQALDSGEVLRVDALAERFGSLPRGAWDAPPQSALLLPISLPGQQIPMALLVAAVNPRKALDSQYQTFFDLMAAQVSSNLASTRAFERECHQVEALAEIDRVKTTFFSNVSHEFRTPLTLLLGHLEDVLARQGTAMAPKDLGALEVARRSALRLERLVDSLLDFSRTEAGRMQVAFEPVDLAGLTTDLASAFRSAIERAGMRLEVDCPPLMEPVYADRDKWEKIVLNLLSNAFNYTFEGEIRVALRRPGETVEVSVSDTGIGIPAEELPHIFERFHRVEGARGRTHEGAGIGLALVRELVELHGGSVRVESVQGQGSTFAVTLPLGKDLLPAERIDGAPIAAARSDGAGAYVEEALRWLPPEEDPATDRRGAETTTTEAPVTASSPNTGQDRARILVADDNADMRAYIRNLLGESYEVTTVADGEAALAEVRARPPELVISDVMMPRLDGFGLLKAIRSDPAASPIPVILLSARAGEESSVEGLELGADDYLVKPFTARELTARVAAVLALVRLRKEVEERRALATALEETRRLRDQLQADNVSLWEEIQHASNYGELVGKSEAMRSVLLQAEQVAGTHATVLILGETGTGKELLARAIHSRSPRRGRPMVTLNCAALSPTLVESELFGREKGAYTGALTQQAGRFELADGSTLFLDEIGELPLEMQVKLLRLIQEGQFERVGGTKPITVDVRIIAATNRNLEKAVQERKFREDLFFRLNVFPIRMPPLRDRREDIPLLVWAFVKEFGRTMGKTIEAISRPALEALQQHEWPGNIRELRNVIERSMILCQGPTLRVELPAPPGASRAEPPAEDLSLEEVERRHILAVLKRTGWRVSGPRGAAALLGLKPTTLESRMARLGIQRER
jgi:DNA-binding NtrC family response regulator/signal transduction histidine kinase